MRVKLKVLVGKSMGHEITVPVKHFLIGRSEDCHLRPKSDAISRNHCAILTQDAQVVLRDLNSRNGTFLNGERISGDAVLTSGDHVQVGKLEFEVLIKAPKPAEPAPSAAGRTISQDPESLDFDISEWLDDGGTSTQRETEPETRQFQLDETDRLKLAEASEGAATGDEANDEGGKAPKKAPPGKLPPRPAADPGSSRDAAADMLKKFFNSR